MVDGKGKRLGTRYLFETVREVLISRERVC